MSSLLLKLFSNDIPCAVLVAVAKMNRNLQQQLLRVVHVRANADGDNVVLVELVRAIHIDLDCTRGRALRCRTFHVDPITGSGLCSLVWAVLGMAETCGTSFL